MGRKAGAMAALLVLSILNHLSHIRTSTFTYWEESLYASADLEEAMSSVSLSEPEGSILRYVHVRGFHHPLIDPAKQIQTGYKNPYRLQVRLKISNDFFYFYFSPIFANLE